MPSFDRKFTKQIILNIYSSTMKSAYFNSQGKTIFLSKIFFPTHLIFIIVWFSFLLHVMSLLKYLLVWLFLLESGLGSTHYWAQPKSHQAVLLQTARLLPLAAITDSGMCFTSQHSLSIFNFLDKIQVKWSMTIPTLKFFLNS